jgi:hypothetical protein
MLCPFLSVHTEVKSDQSVLHTHTKHTEYQAGKKMPQLASLERIFQMLCSDMCSGGKGAGDVGQLGSKE